MESGFAWPWLLASYIAGGVVGLVGALIVSGSSKLELIAQNDLLQRRIDELELNGTGWFQADE